MSVEYVPLSFVDTSILVYGFAADDPARSPIAQALVDELMSARAFLTSTQVLQEFYVTMTGKIRRRVTSAEALRHLEQLAQFPVFTNDYNNIREAIEISADHKFSFWDALIVVSAARSHAARLYTEDLQHGRVILGVEIVNPFREKRAR
ncbi:MAG TPA: PIN domain-containing protein [Bryobacteraceae bacterium]|jgi:predicted nucleic acid-binding protein